MFNDNIIEDADFLASEAPADVVQAVADFDMAQPIGQALRVHSAPVALGRGTWFDEGYDIREPAGTTLTAAVLAAVAAVDTRKNKRCHEDQRNHETITRKLVANAIRCASFHSPELVAVQRRDSAYKGKPAYLNGKAMRRTTDLFARAGLIDLKIGRVGQTATTFNAKAALLLKALESGVTDQSLTYRMPSDRLVRLREGNRDTDYVEFVPTAETMEWTARLQSFNDFLAEQDIGIDLSAEEEAQLTAKMNKERSADKPPYIKPELNRKCLYRQFNNGSFAYGGRLYGGWWVNCPKKLRNKITINGKPTILRDFSGCAIRMLYHKAQIDYSHDPYLLEPLMACEQEYQLGKDYFREPVKRMMQALINGEAGKKNEQIRMPSGWTFRPYFKRNEIVDLLMAKHNLISDYFYSGIGLKLQRIDSDIALDVINNLQNKGIPCLPIHDGFIVSIQNNYLLMQEMGFSYQRWMGGYQPVIK